MRIHSKPRITSVFLILFITALLLIGGCAPSEPVPAPQTPAPSETLAAQETPAPPPPTPSPTPDAVPLEEIPAATEDGFREYRYAEQLVEDWLGDFDGAQAIREMLLAFLDAQVNKSTPAYKEDFYKLFLGRPAGVTGGWLVPAGKQGDGEWISDVYFIPNDQRYVNVTGVIANNRFYSINRTHVQTPYGDYSVFFTRLNLPADVNGQNASPYRAKVTFSSVGETALDIPAKYPYLLVTAPYEAYVKDIVISDAAGNALDLFQWKQCPRHPDEYTDVQSMYMGNTFSTPMLDIKSNLADKAPSLDMVQMQGADAASGTLYASELRKGDFCLYALAPGPLEQLSRERTALINVGAQRKVAFIINGKDFGTPTAVQATLYSPTGTQALSSDGSRVGVSNLKPGLDYMLHVRAAFGPYGYIEWVVHLST